MRNAWCKINPTYPTPNPNDKQVEPAYTTKGTNYPSYSLDTRQVNQLNMCYGKIVSCPTNEP